MALPIAGIAVASLAVKVFGSLFGRSAAKRDAERMKAEQKRYIHENKVSTLEALRLNLEAMSAREIEEYIAANQKRQMVLNQRNRAVSTAVVTAAEGGVAGQSVEAVQQESLRAASEDLSTIDVEFSFLKDQIMRQRDALVAQAKSRINSLRESDIRGPSAVATGLQIGADVLGTSDFLIGRNTAGTLLDRQQRFIDRERAAALEIPL